MEEQTVKDTFKDIIRQQILHLEFKLENEDNDANRVSIQQQIYALTELLSV
jgi:hypothetical protein